MSEHFLANKQMCHLTYMALLQILYVGPSSVLWVVHIAWEKMCFEKLLERGYYQEE